MNLADAEIVQNHLKAVCDIARKASTGTPREDAFPLALEYFLKVYPMSPLAHSFFGPLPAKR